MAKNLLSNFVSLQAPLETWQPTNTIIRYWSYSMYNLRNLTCSSTWLGSMSQIRSSYGSVLSFSVSWEINSLKRMESRFFESKNIRNQSPRSAFFMRRSRRSSFEYPVLALRWKLKIIKLGLQFLYFFWKSISNQFKTSNWILIIRST